jgi:hypothetical protein
MFATLSDTGGFLLTPGTTAGSICFDWRDSTLRMPDHLEGEGFGLEFDGNDRIEIWGHPRGERLLPWKIADQNVPYVFERVSE